MHPDIEALKRYWKEIEYECVTTDKSVCSRPCFLFAAQMAAGTGGAATAVIRDGTDTGADPVLHLAAITSSSDPRTFDPPIPLKRGLFADLGSNVTSLTLLFLEAKTP